MTVTASVVIPAYNSADTISRAVNSVLDQTLRDFEVIIVDDGSVDDTSEIVQQYEDQRVKYQIHEENKGGSAARNTGIEQAEGEYIAFLDADDEWHPTKLEQQIECLESRSDEWIAAYCDYRQGHPSLLGWIKLKLIRKKKRKEGGEELIDDLLSMDLELGGASTLLIKSDTVETIDGFDERFPRHQDWEFLIRVLKQGKLAYVDEDLVTKHGSGRPSIKDVTRAKNLYLNKFEEEISAREARGHTITDKHWFNLAMHYFHQGRFTEGSEYLSKVNTFESIRPRYFLFTAAKGVKTNLHNHYLRQIPLDNGSSLPEHERNDV